MKGMVKVDKKSVISTYLIDFFYIGIPGSILPVKMYFRLVWFLVLEPKVKNCNN